jgi:hypothetical protein
VIEQFGGGTVFAITAAALVVLAAYAALESWMLYTKRRPITQYVREGVDQHAQVATFVAFIAGALLAHFLWR